MRRLERGLAHRTRARVVRGGKAPIDGWCNSSSFLSPGGSYLCKSRGIGDPEAADTCAHLPKDVMASAGNIILLGNPNGLLISVPTVPPHETAQITGLSALDSPCLCRAYTQRRLIGTIHYMGAVLFQATGHSW